MGKLADTHRLKCVHCHSIETPLWRTGPDGPKTLCNACGVRFKKGKLVLYKDDNGNLTAVKREDSLPVHVPPPSKKSLKKPFPASPVGSPSLSDSSTKRVVRKVPSEGSILPAPVAKKPRSRVRRANAGQLPGRYLSKLSFDSQSSSQLQWRSPTDSPDTSPSSPADSPRLSVDMNSASFTVPSSFSMDDLPNVYDQSQAHFPEEDHLFADMACLGLDASADPNNNTLLPMAADPSSAEQFTFAFSGIGRDACLALDTPDRTSALRALLLDRTCNVSKHYDMSVQAISRLYEHRRHTSVVDEKRLPTADDCKNFVRSFAHLHNVALSLDSAADSRENSHIPVYNTNPSAVMLSEKTLHSAAVESLRSLMDSTELVGFAEACLIELVAEDVAASSSQPVIAEYDHGVSCRLSEAKITQPKAISTPA